MSAHATHPTIRLWSPNAWKISIVGFATVSLGGVLALLIGFDSGGYAEEIVTAGASVATGVLGHLAPRPAAS